MNILLVQLVSNGDCLFVTTIARQIKEVDYPGCNLTWMIGERCRQVLINNPHVDEVISIPITNDLIDRSRIPDLIKSLKRKFDKIVITENIGENLRYFYGTFKVGYLRSYGKKITVPIEPVICLLPEEVDNVAKFAKINNLEDKEAYTILFECSPLSLQSSMNIDVAIRMSKKIIAKYSNVKIVLSAKDINIELPEGIINGSVLSWRENAELIKYCKFLIGCSSGITWLNTSTWAAKIPMVQMISQDYGWGVTSASVEYDFMHWGWSTENLIEFDDNDEYKVIECASIIIEKSFKEAKQLYPGKKYLSKDEVVAYFAGNATQRFFEYVHSCILPNEKKVLTNAIYSTIKTLCYLISRKIYFILKLHELRNKFSIINKTVLKAKDIIKNPEPF